MLCLCYMLCSVLLWIYQNSSAWRLSGKHREGLCNLQEEVNLYFFLTLFASFLSLSLSSTNLFRWRTHKHTHGRPLAPAAIINRVFHFSRLKATLSQTECDSDATEVRHTVAFVTQSQGFWSVCVTTTQGTGTGIFFRESSLKVNTGLRI